MGKISSISSKAGDLIDFDDEVLSDLGAFLKCLAANFDFDNIENFFSKVSW